MILEAASVVVLLLQSTDETLSGAIEKAGKAERYAFRTEMTLKGMTRTGSLTTVVIEGAYQKDRPVLLKTGSLELYRQGSSLACEVKKEWRRIEGEGGVPKVPGQASMARMRRLVLPHEEIAEIRKCFEPVRRLDAREGTQSVYAGELTPEGAKRLFEADAPSSTVDPEDSLSGSGRFWVTETGDLALIETIVQKKRNGKGRAASTLTLSRWITLSLPGAAAVEAPEEALRVLEEK